MRRRLDAVYWGAGALAALCLIAILLIIVAQMICRWMGVSFPGSTAYAGYFMASASFLAFAYALNANSHIRVNLFLTALGENRYWAEVWCFGIGSLATSWMAYNACRLVWWSWKLNDISQERDALPLWIPQFPVAIGAVLLAICFIDNFVTLILTRRDNVDSSIGSGGEI
ncbi:MAG: TRAP transporter small permease [Hyphomicrobiaceae bacterium]